jgi:hypothetical protein
VAATMHRPAEVVSPGHEARREAFALHAIAATPFEKRGSRETQRFATMVKTPLGQKLLCLLVEGMDLHPTDEIEPDLRHRLERLMDTP